MSKAFVILFLVGYSLLLVHSFKTMSGSREVIYSMLTSEVRK